MGQFRYHINKLFAYSKSERNGIVALLIIIIALFVYKYYINDVKTLAHSDIEHRDLKQDLAEFKKSLREKKPSQKHKHTRNNETKNLPVFSSELFEFDPNYTTNLEWKRLGFHENQIKTINNYLATGAKFTSKKDLKKIYGISDKQVERLKPYIKIKHADQNEKERKFQFKSIDTLQLELNAVDAERLKQIRGIGEVFSGRIIKYKERLGGFYNKRQLLEVYGIDEEIYNKIKNRITVDSLSIKKLNINRIEFNDLAKHPYINIYYAKALIKYRNHKQHITEIEDLLKDNVLPKETYQRIKNYLAVN